MTVRSDPGSVEWLALGTLATVWLAASFGAAASAHIDRVGQMALLAMGAVVALGRGGLGRPHRWLLVVASIMIAAGAAADRRWVPVEREPYVGEVVLSTDPRGGWPVVWAEGTLADGRRVEVRGTAEVASALESASAGDRLRIDADLAPIDDTAHHRSRHLVGRASINTLHQRLGPAGWRRPVEWVRQVVVDGAPIHDEAAAALYLGLVVGDDRAQDVVQRSRFRAAGLTHLLAVSGQNVAFVLAAVSPVIRRLGRRSRLGAVALVLIVFAVVTRLEPSVLRATWTAAVATWALLTGRASTGVTTVSAAVSLVLLVDPALRLSLGFRLSVAATLGILVLGPLCLARLRGPSWLRAAVAVTVSAQLGVLPLLDRTFGPVPLASLPANVLAGPAAGAVMTWGMTVGPLLGLFGPAPAIRRLAELPVRLALRWLDGVAAFSADLPLPGIDVPALLVAGGLWGLISLVVGPRGRRPLLVIVAVASAVAIVRAPTPPPPWIELTPGAELVRLTDGDDDLTVLVLDRPAMVDLVDALVSRQTGHIDLLIALHGGRATRDVVAAVRGVAANPLVLAPAQHRIPGAVRIQAPVVLGDGPTGLLMQPAAGDRLEVVVTGRSAHVITEGWGKLPDD